MTKVTPRGAEVSEERAALVHQQRALRTRLAATAPEIEWTPPPSLALPEAVLRIHRARLDQLRQVVPHSPRSSALSAQWSLGWCSRWTGTTRQPPRLHPT